MKPAPLNQEEIRNALRGFGDSLTFPADAYLSPDVLAWERENLWRSVWVCVGRLDEILAPGQLRAVDVGGEGVLLSREADGSLRAFSNVCRHRGHELAPIGDPFDARQIRCPYHSWSYRFDGTLRTAPKFTQSNDFDPAEYPLMGLGVAVYGGWVWIDLSGTAPSIDDHFGNLAEIAMPYEIDRLVTAATHSYVVDANWKIIIENYNECYHCSSIHPELCEVTPPDSGYDHVPTGMWCGGTMDLKDHAVTMSLDGSSKGVNFRGIDETQARQVWYLTVMPNLLLSLHPDYVMTHRLTPVSVDQTFIECSWLFPPEAFEVEGFDPSYAVDFWDITNREDWTACESVMRGMKNRGYRPGPLSNWEGTVYQFLGIMAHAYLGEGLVVPEVPTRELR
ncbi:MAG TPA: aromatic ring-hydroxylating dioxygenase subunit alpha [Acidimicrobiia bacterium]|nr:aromatic ring-hydroxylating dioxygenase subunit alpha [Acidimicrobiia bacterium]